MTAICKSCVNSGIAINGEFCVCPAGKKLKEESTRMTDQELKEIRDRLEAATPGPWEANYQALKNLIEHAPNDIRRLLDEVERLRGMFHTIQEVAKKDGISKELDECYVLARGALEG